MYSAPMAYLILASTAASGDHGMFTLYRSSVVDPVARIHVASFDTNNGPAYNAENCALVADLLQRQDGIKTRFWCEPGEYQE